MDENKKSGLGVWVSGIIGFLLGLVIGLVVLGWWLWPVEWTNGTPEILGGRYQQDFLRAAIDSYAYQPDDELAQQRFQALGASGPSTLAAIAADPGAQSIEAIEGFAAAVGASAALETVPEAPAAPKPPAARPLNQTLIIGLGLIALLVVAALLLLSIRRRSQKRAAEASLGDTAPVTTAAAAPPPTVETSKALPEWLQEAAPTGYETLELAEGGAEAPLEEREAEFDLLGGEAEQSLTDEDIEAITSSRFGAPEEAEIIPDFLKEAAPAAAVAPAFLEEEERAEAPTAAELIEEAPAEVAAAVEAPAVVGPAVVEAPSQRAVTAELEETQAEAHAKFSQDIQTVSGIGPVYAEKLRRAGIIAPLLLLRNGATARGRQQIAEATGISEKMILKWVNYVDLFRIKGVDEGYAALLEAAGVDSVPELATRDPQNLHAALLEVIEQKRPNREPPTLAMVEAWVAQAKKLPRAIHY